MIEHPDITRIERDGYAREPIAKYTCSECGEPIYVGECGVNIPGWGWICEDCIDEMMEEVEE